MCKKPDKNVDKRADQISRINPWVCGAIIILFIVIVCCCVGFFMPKFTFSNADNIVLTFLGALATFVVVSNYVQILEIKKDCNKKLEDFKSDWIKEVAKLNDKNDEMTTYCNTEFEELRKYIKGNNSNNIIDIKKIKYQIDKEEKNTKKVCDLLNKLLVYENLSDYEIRSEILNVLDSAMYIGVKSENVALSIKQIARSITPDEEKENQIINDVYVFAYEFMDLALIHKNLNTFCIASFILNRVSRLSGKLSQAKYDLQQLKNHYKNPLYLKCIDSIIGNLGNKVDEYPKVDEDVWAEIEKCKNDELKTVQI